VKKEVGPRKSRPLDLRFRLHSISLKLGSFHFRVTYPSKRRFCRAHDSKRANERLGIATQQRARCNPMQTAFT
jgi:hypothetical protein